MKKYQICVDDFGNFTIPFFNFEGNLIGLQRYHPQGVILSRTNGANNHCIKDGEPVKAMFLKGCKTGLFGYQDALNNEKIQTIIVCESPFKALHLQIQGLDGQTNLGVFGRNILAIGVAGAGNLAKHQADIFKNRHVEFLYDFDEAGQRGILVDAKKIADVAKSVCCINKHLTRHWHLQKKYNKIDLSDDYFVEGGTLEEFLQDRAEYKQQISVVNVRVSGQGGDDSSIRVEMFNPSDLGNAKRLVARHGNKIRYCFAWGKWLIWDGKVWLPDGDGEILRLAKDTVKNIYQEASKIFDETQRKAIAKWAVSSESEHRLRAMISLAESEEGVPVSTYELDNDSYLLNCHNGVIDLKTGRLKPHDSKHLITKIIHAEYHPDAKCQEWIDFLETVFNFNCDVVQFLQRAIGYSLTGDTSEQCLFLLHGLGANGKSTLLNCLSMLLADYAQNASFETFLIQKNEGVRNDLARMMGVRFVSAIEAEGERRLSESLIKQLTGGDTITARFLFGEYFDFKPTFKIWLAANHKPNIRGTDYAIWRRIRLIPFNVTISEGTRDPRLLEKFKDEMPGILAWAVQGCLGWQKNGLQTPDEVKSATNEYRGEMDSIGTFLSECCILIPDAKTPAGKLYETYKAWCERDGEHILNQRGFGTRLSERGFERIQSSGRWWRGIGIRENSTH